MAQGTGRPKLAPWRDQARKDYEAANLTLDEIAARAGVSRTRIQQAFRHMGLQRRPPVRKAAK